MFSWLKNRINGNEASKSLAKSRLHFVLVQDRTGLGAEAMAEFKKEMIGVIKKFFTISDDDLDISYKRDGTSTTLLINSPVIVRRGGDLDDDPRESRRSKKSKQIADTEAEPAPA